MSSQFGMRMFLTEDGVSHTKIGPGPHFKENACLEYISYAIAPRIIKFELKMNLWKRLCCETKLGHCDLDLGFVRLFCHSKYL